MKKNNFVLFSGGSGGHVIPAVNFGNYLIDKGYECTLFSDRRGLKYSNNFKGKIININSGHLSGSVFFKLKSFLLIFLGLMESFYFLFKIKPKFCIGFGSYASFTPLTIALILNFFKITKIYLHEQNSVLGKVNLFFVPFSKKIFLNFAEVKNMKSNYLKKSYHVGLPNEDKGKICTSSTFLRKEKKIRIFVYGGSQGSVNLNRGFFNLIDKLKFSYYNKLLITIQSSVALSSKMMAILNKLNIDVEIQSFFKNIDKILTKSDIIIARSGAGTINDIIKYQIPSILVPLPHAIYNHQSLNAKYLVDKKAAKIVSENELDSEKAFLVFTELLDNIEDRKSMTNKLKKIKMLNANKLMIEKILE